jgi:hypothetical protein
MADRSSQTGGRPTGHPAHRAFARSALWPVRACCQEYVSLEFEILKFPLNDLYRVGSHFRQIHLASGSNSEKLINSFWQYIS